MQAAGDLVPAAAELAAGVEDGEHHLQGGLSGLGLDVHRDTASVVGDRDGIAGVDGHRNVGAVAGQSLIDGVVHDLIHQMVQAGLRGGADVHSRTLPHRLQPLQHLDLRAAIFMLHLGGVQFQFFSHSNLRLVMGPGASGWSAPAPLSVLFRWERQSVCCPRRGPRAAYHSNRFSSARFSRVAGESWEI